MWKNKAHDKALIGAGATVYLCFYSQVDSKIWSHADVAIMALMKNEVNNKSTTCKWSKKQYMIDEWALQGKWSKKTIYVREKEVKQDAVRAYFPPLYSLFPTIVVALVLLQTSFMEMWINWWVFLLPRPSSYDESITSCILMRSVRKCVGEKLVAIHLIHNMR